MKNDEDNTMKTYESVATCNDNKSLNQYDIKVHIIVGTKA